MVRFLFFGFYALLIILTTGCAGRSANPVVVYHHDDEIMSCESMGRELGIIEEQIRSLLPKTDETQKNIALGISGMFIIIPWFFMDMSDAEQIEVKALRKRYNHLLVLGEENGCSFKRDKISPLY